MASHEHEETIIMLCKEFNLIKPKWTAGKNAYNPDIIDNDTDYEVEMVPSNNKIKDKVEKWTKDRKKVLILRPRPLANDSYDEIYVYNNKNVVRVK